MKLNEAYVILDLPQNTNLDDVKKQYKLLAKKWHPDLNKAPEAEETLKKINEAYRVVSSGKSTDREDYHWQTNQSQGIFISQVVTTNIRISFAESILGCQKEIKFNRDIKCQPCNGHGEISLNNGCTECKGRGQSVLQRGNMIFMQTCSKCHGRTQKTICNSCGGKGMSEAEASVQVSIPGGIINGNILNLRGMGNYSGSFGPMDQYTDAHLHINVTPESELSLEKNDVIFTLELSLYEALVGCKKIAKTILGYQDIEVPPMSRNKDEVIISHLGVNKTGNQRVILDVKYPDDVSKLLETLNDSLNYKVN